MVRVDLHVHSSVSDGTDPPAEVIRRAAAAGLDVVALTDHDTAAGIAQAREALPAGLTLVPGMELSCLLGNNSVHMLAYLFDLGDPALGAETELIRDDRVQRARSMVDKLRELDAPVTWERVTAIADGAVVGRPHIARAMAEAGVVATPADAFTADWIGDGGRAHVGRYAPDPGRAIALVRAAGGVAVLAHPRSPGYEITDEVITGLAAVGLAGVEVFHPDHDDSERSRLTALASRLGLLMTGGSDDHGAFNETGLGADTTPVDQYERLLSRAAVRLNVRPKSRPHVLPLPEIPMIPRRPIATMVPLDHEGNFYLVKKLLLWARRVFVIMFLASAGLMAEAGPAFRYRCSLRMGCENTGIRGQQGSGCIFSGRRSSRCS